MCVWDVKPGIVFVSVPHQLTAWLNYLTFQTHYTSLFNFSIWLQAALSCHLCLSLHITWLQAALKLTVFWNENTIFGFNSLLFYFSVSSLDSDQNIASIAILVDCGDNEQRFCSCVSDFSTSFVICEMHSETLDMSDRPVTYGGMLF